MLMFLSMWDNLNKDKSHIDCANLLQNCVSSQTFTPTCQYFYTDISVISVTFCNSATITMIMIMIMDNGHRWESSTELLPLPSSTSTQRMCRAMQVFYHL